MIGKIEERLTVERAQALAAQAKLESAEHELEKVCKIIVEYEAELQSLNGCDEQYNALLEEKKAAVKSSDNPKSSEILQLEETIIAAESQLKEVCEALNAGEAALESARNILDKVNRAEDWAMYDVPAQ